MKDIDKIVKEFEEKSELFERFGKTIKEFIEIKLKEKAKRYRLNHINRNEQSIKSNIYKREK